MPIIYCNQILLLTIYYSFYDSVTIVLTRKRPEVGCGIKIFLVAVARRRKMAPEEAQRGGRASLVDEAPKFHWQVPPWSLLSSCRSWSCLNVGSVSDPAAVPVN